MRREPLTTPAERAGLNRPVRAFPWMFNVFAWALLALTSNAAWSVEPTPGPTRLLELTFAWGTAELGSEDIARIRTFVTEADPGPSATFSIGVGTSEERDRRAIAQGVLARRLAGAGAYEAEVMTSDDIRRLFSLYRSAFKTDPRDLLSAEEIATLDPQQQLSSMINAARERLLSTIPIDEHMLSRLHGARVRTLVQALTAAGVPPAAVQRTVQRFSPESIDSGVTAWVRLNP